MWTHRYEKKMCRLFAFYGQSGQLGNSNHIILDRQSLAVRTQWRGIHESSIGVVSLACFGCLWKSHGYHHLAGIGLWLSHGVSKYWLSIHSWEAAEILMVNSSSIIWLGCIILSKKWGQKGCFLQSWWLSQFDCKKFQTR